MLHRQTRITQKAHQDPTPYLSFTREASRASLTHAHTPILLPAPHPFPTFSHYRVMLMTSQSSPIPHSLKALFVRVMHFHAIEIDPVFPAFVRELARVEHAVAAVGFDHMGLLLKGEVAPGEGWGDDGAVERKDFVVGDCAGVGEVVNTEFVVRSEQQRDRKEVAEDGVAVWYVDYSLVLRDLSVVTISVLLC